MTLFGADFNGVDLVFLISAIAGFALLLVRGLISMLGLSDDGGGGGADIHDDFSMDHDSHATGDAGFSLLTMHGLTSFFMMFGLGGLTFSRGFGLNNAISILGASFLGIAMMVVMAKLMQVLVSMQSKGNISVANAAGCKGSVYLTIPAGGMGQVQISIQDRLQIFDANTEDGEALATGTRIEVVGAIDGGTVTVKKM